MIENVPQLVDSTTGGRENSGLDAANGDQGWRLCWTSIWRPADRILQNNHSIQNG